MRKEGIVLLFMKAPAGGRVKSRLAADLGEDAAAEIYRNFVLASVSMLEAAGGPFRICFYPRDAEAHVVGWLGPGYRYMAQEGNDLGERMENAFSRVFSEGFRRVVLIGSDIPDLPASFVRAAFAELRTHDVVLGPAQDGGYRSEEHTSELQSPLNLVCRLLLEKQKTTEKDRPTAGPPGRHHVAHKEGLHR